MRRRMALALCMALIGGCADTDSDAMADQRAAAQPMAASRTVDMVHRIEAFIAAQRQADSQSCIAQGYAAGSTPHQACMRDRVAQRRAALAGVTREEPRRGWCADDERQQTLRCFDI